MSSPIFEHRVSSVLADEGALWRYRFAGSETSLIDRYDADRVSRAYTLTGGSVTSTVDGLAEAELPVRLAAAGILLASGVLGAIGPGECVEAAFHGDHEDAVASGTRGGAHR